MRLGCGIGSAPYGVAALATAKQATLAPARPRATKRRCAVSSTVPMPSSIASVAIGRLMFSGELTV
jgi:hypothetical protein